VLTQHYAGGRSRCAAPAPSRLRVNPPWLLSSHERGLSTADHQPTLLTPDTVQGSDVVVTMGCGETCPVFPGHALPGLAGRGPKDQPLDVVRRIVDDVDARVRALLADLAPDLVLPGR
jgi:arsenate reductase